MKQVRRHSMQNGALQGSKVAMTLRFTPIRGKWDHGLVLRWCKTFDWSIDDQNPLTTLKKWSLQHAEHVGHWSRLWSSLITQFIRWRAATTRLHIEATLASSCFILLHVASGLGWRSFLVHLPPKSRPQVPLRKWPLAAADVWTWGLISRRRVNSHGCLDTPTVMFDVCNCMMFLHSMEVPFECWHFGF